MSDVGAIVQQALSQSQTELAVQVQVSVLRQELDLEKEAAKMLLEMLGLGENVDLRA